MRLHPRALGARIQALAAALVVKPAFWLLFIGAMFTWPILRSIDAERSLPHRRPTLGRVRDFSLRDQNGGSLGPGELRGRIWVANFTAVACEPMCGQSRRMLARMGEVQHRTRNLGDAIRLVTLTVDPDRDTPTQMADLAGAFRASRRTWRFLSGSPALVRAVLDDFQVVGRTPQTRFALVDAEMQIRGFYDLTDEAALDLLLRDIGLLASPRGPRS